MENHLALYSLLAFVVKLAGPQTQQIVIDDYFESTIYFESKTISVRKCVFQFPHENLFSCHDNLNALSLTGNLLIGNLLIGNWNTKKMCTSCKKLAVDFKNRLRCYKNRL